MKIFRDSTGREWLVEINVSSIKRVKSLLSVELLKMIDDGFKGLGELLADPISLVDVVYVLCKPEADSKGITDEDFGRAMWGDAIERASDAFLAEFVDFFQDPRIRAGLSKVIEKSRALTDQLMDHQANLIKEFDVNSEAKKLISLSGNSPESSVSTPAP